MHRGQRDSEVQHCALSWSFSGSNTIPLSTRGVGALLFTISGTKYLTARYGNKVQLNSPEGHPARANASVYHAIASSYL